MCETQESHHLPTVREWKEPYNTIQESDFRQALKAEKFLASLQIF